jgi:hypothetical protein
MSLCRREFVVEIGASEWAFGGMTYRLAFPVFSTIDYISSIGRQSIVYKQSTHSVIVDTSDIWLLSLHIQLPRDAVFKEILNADPGYVRTTLAYRHLRYEDWWKLTKQLCSFARSDDVCGVRDTIIKIRRVCAQDSAYVMSSVLPSSICRDIGMKAGGMHCSAEYAIFYCKNKHNALKILLDEGGIDKSYGRDRKGILMSSESDTIEHPDCFHKIEIGGVPFVYGYLNKQIASYFDFSLDDSSVTTYAFGYVPIILDFVCA